MHKMVDIVCVLLHCLKPIRNMEYLIPDQPLRHPCVSTLVASIHKLGHQYSEHHIWANAVRDSIFNSDDWPSLGHCVVGNIRSIGGWHSTGSCRWFSISSSYDYFHALQRDGRYFSFECSIICESLNHCDILANHTSQSLHAQKGTWSNFGAPILSELWFPASERTMATAIAATATYAGRCSHLIPTLSLKLMFVSR